MADLTCKQCLDFLDAYLDDTLDRDVRTTFESHVDACPPCRGYMSTYEQTVRMTRALGRDDPCEELPDELVEAIVRTLKNQGPA